VTGILAAIGNTPLARLRHITPANGAQLWVKLEYLNPTGSLKDRMALAMIEGAERDGLLSPGDTVVEYTGGSTGPALALVCRAKGYRALIVMADCFTEERFRLLRALGAEIDVVESVEGPPRVTAQDIANMVRRAAELARRPGHYATHQFENPYVAPAHREGLGRELWDQTGGKITGFVQGVGTGTSLVGVSQALKPRGVHIRALHAAESPYAMQGWAGRLDVPQWDAAAVDSVDAIGNDEAIAMTARLAREEGIFAGVSTGANVVGALRLAERLGPDAVVATLAVDSGFKYLSVPPYEAAA